jgi:hypothetical protein
MSKGKKYRRVPPSERGYEVVRLIKEGDENFVLVKVRLEDMSKLRVLKTDEKRLEAQREAQRRYRERKAKQKK